MGPHGLPALMREANRFKVRGKGHEVSRLRVGGELRGMADSTYRTLI